MSATDPRLPVISVVDDDEAVRDSLRLLLQTSRYRVNEYASGRHFLSDPSAAKADCWICDLHMPEMSGAEMLERARARGWNVSAIVMTGQGDANLERRLIQAKVVRILEKPVSDIALLEWVEKACALTKRD
ncbi:MAG: response regulator [Proteobacteria bacterium]|nr:response regulator [Pseudomonadota bacterium]